MAEIIEISRLALHDQVASRLRTMLVEGQIAPGAKLNERELCEQLRVSRTPLREAIKLLAAEGLVDLLPNRGAVAVQADRGRRASTPSRCWPTLEGHVGRAGGAAHHRRRAGRAARAALRDDGLLRAPRPVGLLPHQRAASTPPSTPRPGTRCSTSTYRSINARVQSLRFRSNQNEAKWKRAVTEHEHMIEALAARDAGRDARRC